MSGKIPKIWLSVAVVFVLAGVVKGVVGLGLPTMSMALLTLSMPPMQAAALLMLPSLITNIWQIRPWSWSITIWQRLAGMQVGVAAGTIAGGIALGTPGGVWAGASLGTALVAYSAWGLSGASASVSPGHESWLGPAVGLVTGLITAATGVFVVPATPYLQSLRLDRDGMMQALGISFMTSSVALLVSLNAQGAVSASMVGWSASILAPALLRMAIDEWARQRLSRAMFRRCFFAGLGLLGLHLVTQAWIG